MMLIRDVTEAKDKDKAKEDKTKAELEDDTLLSAFKKMSKIIGMKPEAVRAISSRVSMTSAEQDALIKLYRDKNYGN